jgi:hypothetical protein
MGESKQKPSLRALLAAAHWVLSLGMFTTLPSRTNASRYDTLSVFDLLTCRRTHTHTHTAFGESDFGRINVQFGNPISLRSFVSQEVATNPDKRALGPHGDCPPLPYDISSLPGLPTPVPSKTALVATASDPASTGSASGGEAEGPYDPWTNKNHRRIAVNNLAFKICQEIEGTIVTRLFVWFVPCTLVDVILIRALTTHALHSQHSVDVDGHCGCAGAHPKEWHQA